jgi:hypothetical protein
LFDGRFTVLTFTALAVEQLQRNEQQQQTTRTANRGNRDVEAVKNRAPTDREKGDDEKGRSHGDIGGSMPLFVLQLPRGGKENRHIPRRIHHDKHRHGDFTEQASVHVVDATQGRDKDCRWSISHLPRTTTNVSACACSHRWRMEPSERR